MKLAAGVVLMVGLAIVAFTDSSVAKEKPEPRLSEFTAQDHFGRPAIRVKTDDVIEVKSSELKKLLEEVKELRERQVRSHGEVIHALQMLNQANGKASKAQRSDLGAIQKSLENVGRDLVSELRAVRDQVRRSR